MEGGWRMNRDWLLGNSGMFQLSSGLLKVWQGSIWCLEC